MRILVIEDEPRLARNLAKAMREEGYAVDTAETGDEGLFKAETCDYDVVVLDVMLPGLDGWQVLERLRKKKTTPVLMLTCFPRTPHATGRAHLRSASHPGARAQFRGVS